MTIEENKTNSEKGNVFASSFLMIFLRLLQRCLGLVSTLVLARLLTPEDFGTVALASITVHFFNGLGSAGAEQYILQKTTVTTADINSAWTLDLILKGTLWLVLFCSAEVISKLFLKQNVASVIRVLSLFLIIQALQNPGLLILKKNLDYTKIFWMELILKVSSFAAVVTIAMHYRSYWALVVGDLISVSIVTFGSYIIHSHRPKFDFSHIKQQFIFSQWVVLDTIFGLIKSQIDNFTVSRLFGSSGLGRYNMIKEIVLMPTVQLLQPITSPLLASLSSIRDNHNYLNRQIRVLLIIVISLCSMIISYLMFFSKPIVATLLGKQWIDCHMLMDNFSGLILATSLGLVNIQILMTLGKVRLIFFYNVVFLAVVLVAVLISGKLDLEYFATMISTISIIGTTTMLVITQFMHPFQLLRTFWLSALLALSPFVIAFGISNITYPQNAVLEVLISGVLHCCCSGVLMIVPLIVFSKHIDEFRYLTELLARVLAITKIKILTKK